MFVTTLADIAQVEALLQRQQALIDDQRREIVILRAERDEARAIRSLLVQIRDEQEAVKRHLTIGAAA